MTRQIEIYKDAIVKFNNGNEKRFEAIYPTFNGLITGKITEQRDIYERSVKRRFGRSKPVEKQNISYYIFKDNGFIRDNEYTFFNGKSIKAYDGKLTHEEKWMWLHL